MPKQKRRRNNQSDVTRSYEQNQIREYRKQLTSIQAGQNIMHEKSPSFSKSHRSHHKDVSYDKEKKKMFSKQNTPQNREGIHISKFNDVDPPSRQGGLSELIMESTRIEQFEQLVRQDEDLNESESTLNNPKHVDDEEDIPSKNNKVSEFKIHTSDFFNPCQDLDKRLSFYLQ